MTNRVKITATVTDIFEQPANYFHDHGHHLYLESDTGKPYYVFYTGKRFLIRGEKYVVTGDPIGEHEGLARLHNIRLKEITQ